jgi:methyltransferase (TIGR00027 family)
MEAGQHSKTALGAAFYRAQHHLHDDPKLIDDPFAERLLTADEMRVLAERRVRDGLELGIAPGPDADVLARTLRELTPASSVLVRARYTEDRLALAIERGIDQYVLVGAGLDTFAFRRAELGDRLQVFEIDHPQSQAFKRERLAAAGLAPPSHLHFGVADFEHESAADALRRLPFRADRPALFAWLGVTMYLTHAAIDATWRALASVAAPGSELVFDFLRRGDGATPASPAAQRFLERLAASGEPIRSALDVAALPGQLAEAGWSVVELLDQREIEHRYFASRADGYHARPHGGLACVGRF